MEIGFLFFSVILGGVLAYSISNKKYIPHILAFSGAFLLAITLFEVLPKLQTLPGKTLGVYILIGIVIQFILDFFSKGAEHGHFHTTKSSIFPWAMAFSLCIHAFLEGMIANEGYLWLGIAIHKIPIALILTHFLQTSYSKSTVAFFLIVFAVMSPLGSFVGISPELQPYFNKMSAITVGILLHVSTTILFESSKDHSFNLSKLISIFFFLGLISIVDANIINSQSIPFKFITLRFDDQYFIIYVKENSG